MHRSARWAFILVVASAAVSFRFAQANDRKVASATPETSADLAKATFAGGCFWCMEPPFDKLQGVVSTTAGYAGGDEPNPTYKSVSAGRTHHAEVVQIVYDPAIVSYETLLNVFWRNVDPVTPDRQFCDRGAHYRTAIFAHDASQLAAARASKTSLEATKRFNRPIVTEISEVKKFTPAEPYHQDYYEKNPIRYSFYRQGCGRDARLEALWGEEAGGGHLPKH